MPELDPAARIAALEHDLRRVFAIVSAQEFLIEILLANFIAKLGFDEGKAFVDDVMCVGSRTDHLTAADDAEAEALADIAVRSQAHLERLVQKALARAG